MHRVVAVEDAGTAAPVEAIVVDEERPKWFLTWWGGSAVERTDIGSVEALVAGQQGWRAEDLELPEDWENGYLASQDGSIAFVYGDPPQREDWRPSGGSEWRRLVFALAVALVACAVAAGAIGELPAHERSQGWTLFWLAAAAAAVVTAAWGIPKARAGTFVHPDLREEKERERSNSDRVKSLQWLLIPLALLADDILPPRWLAAAMGGFAGMMVTVSPIMAWARTKAQGSEAKPPPSSGSP